MSAYEGKTVVLTGAGGGIGRKIAEVFHSAGASLVLSDVDAGLLGILTNLSPVITISLAALLLSEKLNPQQFAGEAVQLPRRLKKVYVSANSSYHLMIQR